MESPLSMSLQPLELCFSQADHYFRNFCVLEHVLNSGLHEKYLMYFVLCSSCFIQIALFNIAKKESQGGHEVT